MSLIFQLKTITTVEILPAIQIYFLCILILFGVVAILRLVFVLVWGGDLVEKSK